MQEYRSGILRIPLAARGYVPPKVVRAHAAHWVPVAPRTPTDPVGEEQGGAQGKSDLNETKREILKHCRRKAHTGERIATHLNLSYDYVRKLLADLVKAGRLRNDSEGYRTV
jgi:predicted HTH transcriptional regulator